MGLGFRSAFTPGCSDDRGGRGEGGGDPFQNLPGIPQKNRDGVKHMRAAALIDTVGCLFSTWTNARAIENTKSHRTYVSPLGMHREPRCTLKAPGV